MKYLVAVRLSVSPDVTLAYCTLKIYVPGGVGGRGATISWGWWLFCLGLPSQKIRWGGGRTVGHKNPKYVAPHKGTSVWWSSAEWASLSFISISGRLNITQAVCGYPGDGQWRPLMSRPSDRAERIVDAWVALTLSDKEAHASVVKVVRWVMFSKLIMWRLLV